MAANRTPTDRAHWLSAPNLVTALRIVGSPALILLAINDKAVTDDNVVHLDPDITDSVTLLGHKFEVLDDRIERIEKAIMAASDVA